jgi:ketosteroid isomerase-like protein
MSQENVELIVGLQLEPSVDWAWIVRDDATWSALSSTVSDRFHPDFEATIPLFGSAKTYNGLNGLREAWRDWLAPWVTWRSEIEEAIDLDDGRVLLLNRDYARAENSDLEMKNGGAAIWTVRDGKVARFDAYANRSDALNAAGLSE